MSEFPTTYSVWTGESGHTTPSLGHIEHTFHHTYELSEAQLDYIAAEVAARLVTPEPDELLSSDEAAAWLKCSRSQLSALVASGRLPVVRFDAFNRYLRSDLEAFARQHRQDGAS